MAISSACSVCSKTEAPLQACVRCRSASYCSKDCQVKHWPTHKEDCKRPNYILQFRICPDEITDPPVWRTLSVPATTSFSKLHRALQIAFGWASTHSYEFGVHDPDYDPEAEGSDDMIALIKKLPRMDNPGAPKAEDTSPRKYVLRVTDDAESTNTGGYGSGPVDRMHKSMWEHSRTPERKASQVKLFEVLDKKQYKGLKMSYTYDYGDCWVHDISVVGTAPATAKIRCTNGESHGIPEDAGNIQGWKDILEAYRTTSPKKAQLEKRLWFENQASNADPEGLLNGGERRFDKDLVNMALSVLA